MKFKPEDFFEIVEVKRDDGVLAEVQRIAFCNLASIAANDKLEEFLKTQVIQIDSATWYKHDGEGWRKMTVEEQLEYSK